MAPSVNAPEPGSAARADSGQRLSRRPGSWRWLAWITGGVLALFGVLLLAVVLLGHSLNRPWLKARIVAAAQQQGLRVDYAGLDLSLWDGVSARELRIFTPEPLAAGAETFVSVSALELRARLWALAFGLKVGAVRVGSIELALVADEHGHSTLSELFPPGPEPRPPTVPWRLSQLLATLPPLSLDALSIGAIRVRRVELRDGRPVQALELATLGLEGEVHSGKEGLAGTQLRMRGAPQLELSLRQGQELRRARLDLQLGLRATEAATLALEARLDTTAQDLAPGWPQQARLLALRGTLHFDAAASQTRLELAELRALGAAVSAEAHGSIFDAGELRVATSASARLELGEFPPAGLPRAALPQPLRALSFHSLELGLSAHELSWQKERVQGALDAQGRLRELRFDDGEQSAQLGAASWNVAGTFDNWQGQFQAKLEASPTWHSPSLAAELEQLALTLNGTTSAEAAAQKLDAQASLGLRGARLRTAAGERLELTGLKLDSHLTGLLGELPERVLRALDGNLKIAHVELAENGRRARWDELSASAAVRDLAPEPANASGFRGSASLALSAAALDVSEPARGARRVLALRQLDLSTTLPLSLEDAQARLAFGELTTPQASLAGLELEASAHHPLAWAPGSSGEPRATLSGRLARLHAGSSSGVLEQLRASAYRLDADRYRLELDATSSSLVARGQRLPERLTTLLRADAAPRAGTLGVTAALRGGGRQSAVDLDLNARFERQSEKLLYRAGLTAERIAPLIALGNGAVPSTARLSLGGTRLRASGELSGLLRAGPGLLPRPVAHPVHQLRGHQQLALELEGVDLREPERSLALSSLSFDLQSVHGAGGAGSAKTRLRAKSLRYEGDGTALQLEGLDQQLAARFDRAPDEGLMDLHSTLALDAASQSWLPGYPVRDLRCTTDLQIDRRLALSLRELSFDNPGAGTSLRASGALELRADGSAAITGSRTLFGREALSFDGRLQQVLEPLQLAGAAERSSGSLVLPFRFESGGMLGYRFLATLEANQVFFVTHDRSIAIERLNGVIPIVEEVAFLPGGIVMGNNPRSSPLSDARFFDVHPFLAGDNYVTADSIRTGVLPAFGPLAANVRLERTGLLIDQLQVGFSGGQIVGQARLAYRDGDPIVRLRLNATGLHSARRPDDVFDANATLSFEPVAMTLDGKLQIVRASSSHVLDMLDVLDPFRESANANRVRSALALGYPKFVRFRLHDGTVDAKVELGGLAQLVRLNEIKAIPVGPVLQKYLAPSLVGLLPPRPTQSAPALSSTGTSSKTSAASKSATRDK